MYAILAHIPGQSLSALTKQLHLFDYSTSYNNNKAATQDLFRSCMTALTALEK